MLDTPQFWAGIGVLVTGAVAWFGHSMTRPKILAEAKKAEAEAAKMDWLRFQAEIERLELKIAAQDEKIAAQDARIAEQERDRKEVALVADEREAENKSLKAMIKRLEKRLTAIEKLFDVHPLTPELKAALEQINRDHG